MVLYMNVLLREGNCPEGGGEEGLLPPPLHMWVPTSGSSLHLPLMHISWPSQSFKVLQGPSQEEIACEEMMLRRKNTQTKTNIFSICRSFLC
jgi:hypothetical protein